MATKQQQERQQNDNKSGWKPPRGIRYSERPGLPRPYLLHWRATDGSRKCVAYDTKPKREKAAKALVTKIEQSGRSVMDFNPADWHLWTQFREIIGDANPLDVARFWLSKGGPNAATSNIRVSELINRYLEARLTEGTGKASLSHTKGDLARFAEKFGTMAADAVTADMLRAWLRALPYAPTTKRNHHKHGAALYNWSIREGVFNGQNPFRNVEKPPLTTGEVEILTPEQTAAIFGTAQAQRPDACARLALEFFTGLRHSTAAKLDRSEIDFDARGMRIPAAKIKTARPQYIEGLPDNLWAWLSTATDAAWAQFGYYAIHRKLLGPSWRASRRAWKARCHWPHHRPLHRKADGGERWQTTNEIDSYTRAISSRYFQGFLFLHRLNGFSFLIPRALLLAFACKKCHCKD